MLDIKSGRIIFISNHYTSILKYTVESTITASMSFILSLAQYLQNIQSPNYNQYLNYKSIDHLSSNINYYQPWSDYLFSILASNHIIQTGSTIIFISHISQQYFQQVLTNNSLFHIEKNNNNNFIDIRKRIQEITQQTNIIQPPKICKNISIINFSSSVANFNRLMPKIHLQGLYAGQFYRIGDKWHSYRIINNHVPSTEQITRQNVLILTGSSYSVNNMCAPMKRFAFNLSNALNLNKKLKILGTCFGHQFLAHLHGVEVSKRNFVKGTQQIIFNYQKRQKDLPFLDEILQKSKPKQKLFQYHNDHVCAIPKDFMKVGASQTCEIESMISNDKRIWSFQFHPQYSAEYIQSYQRRLQRFEGVQICEKQKSEDLRVHHESKLNFQKAIRQFIDWQI